jgi:hypothetical protein
MTINHIPQNRYPGEFADEEEGRRGHECWIPFVVSRERLGRAWLGLGEDSTSNRVNDFSSSLS